MAKLGFPYHEVVKDYPRFPRLRTVFFRTEPKPLEPLGQFRKPLPKLLPAEEAYQRIRERDVAFIKRKNQPVILIGREPMMTLVRENLRGSGIEIGEEMALPEEGVVSKGHLNQVTKGKSGLIVVAAPDVVQLMRNIIILDRFEYAFASFALAKLPAEGTLSMRLAVS